MSDVDEQVRAADQELGLDPGEVRAWLAGAPDRLAQLARRDSREEIEARLDAPEQAQAERDYDEALQLADDADVVYGDGTAGPARLLRDPYDILADHHDRHDRHASTGPGTGAVTRAQIADALWEGRMSPREAGALFPDMLDKAQLWGIDLDARLNLDAVTEDDAADHVPVVTADDGDEDGWGS